MSSLFFLIFPLLSPILQQAIKDLLLQPTRNMDKHIKLIFLDIKSFECVKY